MSLGLNKVGRTHFYLKKGYGVDLFKSASWDPNLHPNVVVFVNKRAMFLPNALSLKKIYGPCNDPSFWNWNIDWVGYGRRT